MLCPQETREGRVGVGEGRIVGDEGAGSVEWDILGEGESRGLDRKIVRSRMSRVRRWFWNEETGAGDGTDATAAGDKRLAVNEETIDADGAGSTTLRLETVDGSRKPVEDRKSTTDIITRRRHRGADE